MSALWLAIVMSAAQDGAATLVPPFCDQGFGRIVVGIVDVATAVAVEGDVWGDASIRTRLCPPARTRRCKSAHLGPPRACIPGTVIPDLLMHVIARRIDYRSRTLRRTPLRPPKTPRCSSRDS